jgi:membrane protein implicated in regulation of membrane protease activity
MATLYLIAAIVGIGLLLFSSLGIGDADASVTDLGDSGEFLLGVFSTRNLTFFLAAFGATGMILHWLGTNPVVTAIVAGALGLTAMFMVHAVFVWLRRSDSSVDSLGERDFEGAIARVVLPIAPGSRGQVACVIAGSEMYLTAVLAEDVPGPLTIGQEVIILSTDGGVARVMPTTQDVLPSST